MIQPSLAGLDAFFEDYPARGSAQHSFSSKSALFACRTQCWATFTRPCRDSSQIHASYEAPRLSVSDPQFSRIARFSVASGS